MEDFLLFLSLSAEERERFIQFLNKKLDIEDSSCSSSEEEEEEEEEE